MTPDAMKVNLKKLGILDQYDLSRPGTKSPLISVDNYNHVAQILQDKNFLPPFEARLTRVLGNIRGLVQSHIAKVLFMLSKRQVLSSAGYEGPIGYNLRLGCT